MTTVCGVPVHTQGQRANTRMNVKRYIASGMIQKDATAAMSVVMYVVTPSIRLDGAAASPIQGSGRSSVMWSRWSALSMGGAGGVGVAVVPTSMRAPRRFGPPAAIAVADDGVAGAGSTVTRAGSSVTGNLFASACQTMTPLPLTMPTKIA